ncbi:ABC transporter substrate-binding protein [Leucobacter sp. wl10]|uniref:ABC transporter substrate-binding protein n=1 Tax=Leucobacter sp. wl10 TaxID=2304677 RepID=UPI000E5AFE0E|nr:ABC transporter substrate-binding protein [Leucobacter sp. wl10]RGE20363.1 ABC transporter substrate-binding protein [Leucobacter sp. wl10]
MTKKFLGLIAAGAAVALLAGCSGSAGGNESGSSKSGDAGFTTIVDGTLTVGLSPDFPPMEYLDGEKLIGSDVELITEVAKRLNLDVKFEQQKFDQLINSVRTDRVDLVISGMSDTVERQKTLDFIDYYSSTGRFYTTPDRAGDFAKPTDACGVPIAVSTKTDYYPALQEYSAKVCEAAGEPAVKIVGADSGAAARLQLDQGRADLAVQGAENLAYFEEQDPGKYQIVLDVLIAQPFAASVRKGNTALAEAVRGVLQEMYDDGTTEKILTKYGIEDGLRPPAINEVTE